jgi:catechol 2,3-dioxygenase-like lactoylglutathione lyase family enzyme
VINRFDHLVIGVRNLDAGVKAYRDGLGFDVRLGGRHTGRGTENALIRFGLEYLELIAVYDQAEAERAGRDSLVSFLARHDGGLVSYALATTDIEADAARLAEAGLDTKGPFPMERLRPDGKRITWRLLVPGGDQYRRPWPFLIQWDQSDGERLALEATGGHPNGVRGVDELAVLVVDLERAVDLYSRQLGLALLERRAVSGLRATQAVFTLGPFRIALTAPSGPGLARDAVATIGEGPFQVVLVIDRLERAGHWLTERGISLTPATDVPRGLLIDPNRSMGARLVLREIG